MNTYSNTHRKLRVFAGLLAGALAIAACGGDDDDTSGASDSAADTTVTATAETAAAPNTTGSGATSAPATTPASSAAPEDTEPAEPAELTEVSFQTFPNLALGVPIKVATDHGFFEENGLQVNASDGATGPAMVAALAAGQVDLAGVPNFVGMQSNVAGANLQVVAGLTGGGGSVLFAGNDIPRPDTDYPESAQALNDAVLAAAAPGGFSDRLYNFLIDDAGITGAQITTRRRGPREPRRASKLDGSTSPTST